MKILSRYLLRQHVLPFVFALSALTSFELLRQIARKLGELLGKGLPWTVTVEFFALTIPFLIAITLSMSVLVAVLYTISRMAGDHELTAMRAGGVSLAQVMRPLLLAATVVALTSFVFGDQILPRTNHRLRSLMTDIFRTKPTFSLSEHVINEVRKGKVSLRAARIDQATYLMRDVTLYNTEDNDQPRIIYADSGYVAFAPNQEDLHLTLYDGAIHEFHRTDPKMFQQTAFHTQIVLVRGVGSEFVRRETDDYRGDREMGVCQLEEVVRSARHDARVAEERAWVVEQGALRSLVGLPPVLGDSVVDRSRPSLYCRGLALAAGLLKPSVAEAQGALRDTTVPEDRFDRPVRQALGSQPIARVRPTEVRVHRDRARSSRVRAAVHAVELQKKYSIPATCIVFVLVGVPLAMQFPRGGLGLVLGASMVVFSVYYIGLIAGESLANRLTLSPFLAMWASNILMGTLGVLGILWQRRSGSVSRRRLLRRARRVSGREAP